MTTSLGPEWQPAIENAALALCGVETSQLGDMLGDLNRRLAVQIKKHNPRKSVRDCRAVSSLLCAAIERRVLHLSAGRCGSA